jgi:hypothetical protein
MASAAAVTPAKALPSLPEAVLHTLFGSTWFGGGAALWNLFAPAAHARPASTARTHAPAPVRSPLPHQLGYDDGEDEAKISVRLHNMPHGARVSSSASGATLHVDTGKGAKAHAGAAPAVTGHARMDGDGNIERVVSGTAPAAAPPAATAPAAAAPAAPQPVSAAVSDFNKLKARFANAITPQEEVQELQARGLTAWLDKDGMTVKVLEDRHGIPYQVEHAPARPKDLGKDEIFLPKTKAQIADPDDAKIVSLDMGKIYKSLLYDTDKSSKATEVVGKFFDDKVPFIPEEGRPDSGVNPYHGTFYSPGASPKIDGHAKPGAHHHTTADFGSLNAIYFNPNAAVYTDDKHVSYISPALSLLHEIDHAVGYNRNPLGNKVLSAAYLPDSTNLTDLEEERVITGVSVAEANKIMLEQNFTTAQIKEADDVLNFKAGNNLEDDTAAALGEPQRNSHAGAWKIVDDPTDHS